MIFVIWIIFVLCSILKAIQSAPFLRDALNVVQELGGYYNQSGKFKNLYLDQHNADDYPSPSRLKPLCPTRWLSRGAAVRAVLDNYADVVSALDEASSTFGNSTAGRANLVHSLLASVKCVLGLVASLPLIECLDKFNTSLQGVDTTVAGILAAAAVVKENLLQIRDDVECEFRTIFHAAAEKSHQLNIEPLSLPRQRKIPRRFNDGDEQHAPGSAEEPYP